MDRFGIRRSQADLAKRAPGDSWGVPLSLLSAPYPIANRLLTAERSEADMHERIRRLRYNVHNSQLSLIFRGERAT
jgi:hypothetical protein